MCMCTYWNKVSLAKSKRKRNKKIDSIGIGLASPEDIRRWGQRRLPNGTLIGKVDKDHTVDYESLKPIEGGLFCERIFGPVEDFYCSCERKGEKNEKFCPNCEVEFTKSRVRRTRMGYIPLAVPVAHVWYLRGRPSYIANLIGKSRNSVDRLAYGETLCESFIGNSHSPSFPYLAKRKIYDKNISTCIDGATPLTTQSPKGADSQVQMPRKASEGDGFLPQWAQKNLPACLDLYNPKNVMLTMHNMHKHDYGSKMSLLRKAGQQTPKELMKLFSSAFTPLKCLPTYVASSCNPKPLSKGVQGLVQQERHFVSTVKMPNNQRGDQAKPKYRRFLNVSAIKKFSAACGQNASFLPTQNNEQRLLRTSGPFLAWRQTMPAWQEPTGLAKQTLLLSANLVLQSYFSGAGGKQRRRIYGLDFNGARSRLLQNVQESGLQSRQEKKAQFMGCLQKGKSWDKLCFANLLPLAKPGKRDASTNPQASSLENYAKCVFDAKFTKAGFVLQSQTNPVIPSSKRNSHMLPGLATNAKQGMQTDQHINGWDFSQKVEEQLVKKYNQFHTLPLFSTFIYKEWSHRFSFLEFFLWPTVKDDLVLPLYAMHDASSSCEACEADLLDVQHMHDARYTSGVKVQFVVQSKEPKSTKRNPIKMSYTARKNSLNVIRNKFLLRTTTEKTLCRTDAKVRSFITRDLGSNTRDTIDTSNSFPEHLLWCSQPVKICLTFPYFQKQNKRQQTISTPLCIPFLACCSYQRYGKGERTLRLESKEEAVTASIHEKRNSKHLYSTSCLPLLRADTCLLLTSEGGHFVKAGGQSFFPQHLDIFENHDASSSYYQCTPYEPWLTKLAWYADPLHSLDVQHTMHNGMNDNKMLIHFSRALVSGEAVPPLTKSLKDFSTELVDTQQFPRLTELLSFTGGTALRDLLSRFNLVLLGKFLRYELKSLEFKVNNLLAQKMLTYSQGLLLGKLAKRRSKQIRRLKLLELFQSQKSNPEWMILSVLPVLPPDLRPILRVNDDFVVASDLNRLYQTVLRRNNTIRERIDDPLPCPESGLFRQRSLQKAVDGLLENGKGGGAPLCASKRRPLVSLSHVLKGKKGLFRQHLLGKRVDYSGRSVIVVGPKLNVHECGLPKEMAMELFQPFLLHRLKTKGLAFSNTAARQMIQQEDPVIWHLLKQLVYEHPVLLNRAPTLHRLGIQAFQPRLVSGRAILLHPLVCSGFNADFDGDQMAVHVPLSFQARAEAWKIMWSKNNFLSPATGQPILVPSQDMVLGCYYLSVSVPHVLGFLPSSQHYSPTKSSIASTALRTSNVSSSRKERQQSSFQLVCQVPKSTKVNSVYFSGVGASAKPKDTVLPLLPLVAMEAQKAQEGKNVPQSLGKSKGSRILSLSSTERLRWKAKKEASCNVGNTTLFDKIKEKRKIKQFCLFRLNKENKGLIKQMTWKTLSHSFVMPLWWFDPSQSQGDKGMMCKNLLTKHLDLPNMNFISLTNRWVIATSFRVLQKFPFVHLVTATLQAPRNLQSKKSWITYGNNLGSFASIHSIRKNSGLKGYLKGSFPIYSNFTACHRPTMHPMFPSASFVIQIHFSGEGVDLGGLKRCIKWDPLDVYQRHARRARSLPVFKVFPNLLVQAKKSCDKNRFEKIRADAVQSGSLRRQLDSFHLHKNKGHYFSTLQDSLIAYFQGRLQTHTPFWVQATSSTETNFSTQFSSKSPLQMKEFLLVDSTMPKAFTSVDPNEFATYQKVGMQVSQAVSLKEETNKSELSFRQPRYGSSQKICQLLFQDFLYNVNAEGNDVLEAPLELRLSHDGNLVKILTTFQNHYGSNATIVDQCKEKSIRYMRTTAGRVVINKALS